MTQPLGLPAVVRNEFAMVSLSLVPTPSGHALKLTDESTGQTATFDAMELEGLCWLLPEQRRQLLASDARLGNLPTADDTTHEEE